MRLIHHIPFTPSEREHYRRLVFINLVQGIRLILDAMEEWGGEFDHQDYYVRLPPHCRLELEGRSDSSTSSSSHAQKYLSMFTSYPDIADDEPMPASYFEPLRLLWNDGGVQSVYKRGNEAAVPEK
jgi:guanine nucleotide-binding protein subunit alpha